MPKSFERLVTALLKTELYHLQKPSQEKPQQPAVTGKNSTAGALACPNAPGPNRRDPASG
jgi:hypothetical protein